MTCDSWIRIGDGPDQPSAKSLPPVVHVDGQKENVAIPPYCCKSHQVFIFEQQVYSGPTVGFLEKPASLFEDAFGPAYPLFELPGVLDVVVFVCWHDTFVEFDTHVFGCLSLLLITPPSATPIFDWDRGISPNVQMVTPTTPGMEYELVDHTADIGVRGSGSTLGDAFAAVADGMAACHVEEVPTGGEKELAITESAAELDTLLFDYLDTLILERDLQNVLPVNNEAAVTETGDGWVVEATAEGYPLEDLSAREVKAVTYSEMDIAETEDGWELFVVLDM